LWCHFLREKRPPKNHSELDEICAVSMNTVWDLSKKPEQKKTKTKQNEQKKTQKTSRQNKKEQNETKNQTSGLGTLHVLKVGEYQGTYARLPQTSIQSNTVKSGLLHSCILAP